MVEKGFELECAALEVRSRPPEIPISVVAAGVESPNGVRFTASTA